jgi:hypothetical protein
MRNFFLIPQSQFRNLKEALPQSQFRNLLRNVAPQPQFRNHNFFQSPQLQVRNLSLHFRNFRNIFGRGVAWNYIFFLLPGFFCYREDFKGTVAGDFQPLFFRELTHMNP